MRMDVLRKLKTDKRFRAKLFILFVVAVLIVGNVPDDKKEADAAVCEAHNIGGFMQSDWQVNACTTDSCVVQLNYNPGDLGIIGNVINSIEWLVNLVGLRADISTCVAEVATGKYVLASSASEAGKMCTSGLATLADNKLWGDDLYVCKSGTQCSSELQTTIANIVPFDMDCQTRFYVGAFGGGFLALIMILAVI